MHVVIKCTLSAWSNLPVDAINILMTFLRNLRVHRKPGHATRGLICAGTRTIPCALGRSGTGVLKREGDGETPARRILRPVWGFFRADRTAPPKSVIEFEPIAAQDGWCDAAHHACYNLPVKLPFNASHEVMMRDDHLYDLGLVLDWNLPPAGRQRHRGSAIFLHLSKGDYQPTEGCIAVREPAMRWLLSQIDTKTKIMVL